MQGRALEEGDVLVQAALDGLVQLDAVDMLREGLLTALEPQVRSSVDVLDFDNDHEEPC